MMSPAAGSGAGGVTLSVAVPLCPSLVAMMVVVPALTARTAPVPLTVATAALPDAHVTTRPVSTFPLASLFVAVACVVPPTVNVGAASATATEAVAAGGGAVTVSVAEPLCPSLVAVIVVVPGLTALTAPVPLTVATAALLDAHVTTRPVSTPPLTSLFVTVACVVAPTVIICVASATITDAVAAGGAAVTVTEAEPLCPELVAVIVVLPALIALTTPVAPTVAMEGLLEIQVMA